jgi:hypothetical protein
MAKLTPLVVGKQATAPDGKAWHVFEELGRAVLVLVQPDDKRLRFMARCYTELHLANN